MSFKKRFNSHFIEFKKEIQDNNQRLKVSLIDLLNKMSFIKDDYKDLLYKLQTKIDADEGIINTSLSEYEYQDKCKLPNFNFNDLTNRLKESFKKLEQLSKLKPKPKKKDEDKKGSENTKDNKDQEKNNEQNNQNIDEDIEKEIEEEFKDENNEL